MLIPEMFADVAAAFSSAFGGPYFDAIAHWPGTPTYDDGGSITSPGSSVAKACQCQVDSVTEGMRSEAGYRDKDVRLLVLSATLDGPLDTDATVEVQAGPNAGSYGVESCSHDPMGAYWECRGRPAV